MGEIGANNSGVSGDRSKRIIMLCLLVVLNTSADMIVDLGSARDFMFLDINTESSNDALISDGIFEGDIGWSGGLGTMLKLRKAKLSGDIYRTEDSLLRFKRGGKLLGTDYSDATMSGFITDVDEAVARFGSLTQDIDLGDIKQRGGLTIDRTDKYTVVDMNTFKLSSGTLTLNGQANDIFYIRVRDVFELNNVDVVVNGTDSSRVFFIFDGTEQLEFKRGDFYGNIIAPNASVLLANVEGFDGSVISGDGFKVSGAKKKQVFKHSEAIPESTVLGLVSTVGCAAIFIHRFFKFRRVNSSISSVSPNA